MNISLLLNELVDRPLQENFKRIVQALTTDLLTNGSWKLFTLTFDQNTPAGGLFLPHNLNFTPEDGIVTRATGTGAFSFDYAKWSDRDIVINVTGTAPTDPLSVKFIVGRLRGGS